MGTHRIYNAPALRGAADGGPAQHERLPPTNTQGAGGGVRSGLPGQSARRAASDDRGQRRYDRRDAVPWRWR